MSNASPATPTPGQLAKEAAHGGTAVSHDAPSETPPPESTRTTVVRFDPRGLDVVGARPPLGRYLRELWGSRHFIVYDARVRLAISQDHTILGKAWLILNPVLLGLTFFLIFGVVLGTGRGIENFPAYILIGLIMFQFTSRTVVAVSRSMSSGKALVRGFVFPRAALTLSIVVRELMTQAYALGATAVLILLVPPLEPLSWTWLLVLPVVLLQTLFSWGLGMLLAPLVNRVPDMVNLLSFGMRLLMYASGIFYDPSHFIDDERLLAFFHFNPVYQVLTMCRQLVLEAQVPGWSSWAVLIVAALVTPVIGFLVFWRHEESYANEH